MADEKYIKMKDALDAFPTDYSHSHYSAHHWWVQEKIKEIPAADVRSVVRGDWEWDKDPFAEPWRHDHKCNVCGRYALRGDDRREILSNYCPNCGADMREEDKDEIMA